MDAKTLLPLLVTIGLALVGYVAAYLNSLRMAQRKDQLDRVTQQLRDLYGPMYALVRIGELIWEDFQQRYGSRRGDTAASGQCSLAGEETARKVWISEIYLPLNLQLERVIIDHADLLEEAAMPSCLLTLCAHINEYKAIVKRWETGDYSQLRPDTDFPAHDLRAYTEAAFLHLKQEQRRLLGESKEHTMNHHSDCVTISIHDLLAVIRVTGEARQELLTIREMNGPDASLAIQEAVARGLQELGSIDRITAAWYKQACDEAA